MSVQYYQDNAQQFFNDTVNVDMSELYAPFVSHLERGALMLDAAHQPSIELSEFWITSDKRPERDEKWLNCLLHKNG